jgi:glycosyltransferase involved in cell wall biosynthesis
MNRLAIVSTHPIQYYAPWFAHVARQSQLALRVFYLWDFGVTHQVDQGFKTALAWDIPLLEGYQYEFVPNVARHPGTHHFRGIVNPGLPRALTAFAPQAILLMGYNYQSLVQLILTYRRQGAKLLLRGDSHRLVPRRGVKAWLKRQLLRQLFRRLDGALYVGQANRRYFLDHGMAPERLFFAPHAVDNDRFIAAAPTAEVEARAWRRELGIPDTHRVVLFCGKFEPKKRPLDLIRAFQAAAVPDATLVLVGAGDLRPELEEARRGAAPIVLAPFQNQSLMPRTLAAGDVLVLPSYGPEETWGLIVNEAQCLKKAVIVSDHVGCAADLVEPGHTGWVFPAGDVGALTACLREALSDPDRLRALGEHGFQRVAKYSYPQTTQGLLQALETLAPTGHPWC